MAFKVSRYQRGGSYSDQDDLIAISNYALDRGVTETKKWLKLREYRLCSDVDGLVAIPFW